MPLVLIVEDDQELRETLAAALSRASLETAEAADGEDALEILQTVQPDLILCDIVLPRLRGDALLKRIQAHMPQYAHIPFLFLTAFAEKADVLAGYELGADDYITKPVDLDVLIATVNAWLSRNSRWSSRHETSLARERTELLRVLSEQSELSFLAAAQVLDHLKDGVLLTHGDGSIIFANRVARTILEIEDGIALRFGRISLHGRTEDRTLQEYFLADRASQAETGWTPMTVPRPSKRRPYLLHVCHLDRSLGGAAGSGSMIALFLHDPDAADLNIDEAQLVERYGFTRTEARIAAALARGLSVNDVAETHAISRNTVRHHLKSIFRKTNTARQAELVALFLAEFSRPSPSLFSNAS